MPSTECIDTYGPGPGERYLPLSDLDNIQEVDAVLETRQRYVSSSFHTFPWPVEPSEVAVDTVREAARALIGLRTARCVEYQIGLTTLYNQVDEGGHRPLVEAHQALDAAVAEAYGWPASDWAAFRERLYLLNQEISADPTGYRPFAVTSGTPTLF